MKILVNIKRVIDLNQRLTVDNSGKKIDDTGIPYMINPFDLVALEEALRIKDQSAEPVSIKVIGTGGNDYKKLLLNCLAMGADSALHIQCKELNDPLNAARILEKIVETEKPDLILLGERASDDDGWQPGPVLAALLGWSQATFVKLLKKKDSIYHAERETDRGIEKITVSPPAVITCGLRLNEPRKTSIRGIMKARQKPFEQKSFNDLGATLKANIEIVSIEPVTANRNCTMVESPEELLEKLRKEVNIQM